MTSKENVSQTLRLLQSESWVDQRRRKALQLKHLTVKYTFKRGKEEASYQKDGREGNQLYILSRGDLLTLLVDTSLPFCGLQAYYTVIVGCSMTADSCFRSFLLHCGRKIGAWMSLLFRSWMSLADWLILYRTFKKMLFVFANWLWSSLCDSMVA